MHPPMRVEGRAATPHYLPFVDWMKALGIALIVVGHVAARPINDLSPPIYPKQLGVAFFIFVMGYSLAREHRPGWQVLLNRVFELYLFGVPLALIMSAVTYATRGSLALSNYLPFMFGANLLFNNFPANPTTWYIGTYLHILFLWLIAARGVKVRLWMFAVAVPAEIVTRAFLVANVGGFTGYMLATNWVSVFLLGTFCGQRPLTSRRLHGGLAASALVVLAAAWARLLAPAVAERSFPFMRLSFSASALDPLMTSACVSGMYLLVTLLVFLGTAVAAPPRIVRFEARNTLIVFIAHMPVYYAVEPLLIARGWSYSTRALLLVLVCLVGLGLLSELVHRVVRPAALRAELVRRITERSQGVPPPTTPNTAC